MTDATGPIYELDLAPEDVPLLLRQPELLHANSRRRLAAGRPTRRSEIWHDTPEGALAADGLSLAQTHNGGPAVWRMARLVPQPGDTSPPGLPATVVSEHPAPPEDLAHHLVPIAAFDGNARVLRPTEHAPRVVLMQGELRAVAAVRPVCRVVISGEGAGSLALTWAATLRLHAAVDTLAGQALRLTGRDLPHRPLGAPTLAAEQSVSQGFAQVVAHLAGVIAHYAPRADGQHGPEPVHQMRVALRRLRSAISLFRRAVHCPATDETTALLKQLGHVLGPARDWDVFTSGLGQHIGDAFPDDAAVQDLLAAAKRKRLAGYTALSRFLAGPVWRQLGVALAALATERPWETFQPENEIEAANHAELQVSSLPDFAARALHRRHRAMVAPGPDLSALPVEALHEIRLAGKRLRYAAEFFAPLFPGRETRRFLKKMAVLQERLGQINDGAVAAGLMSELGGRGVARAGAVGVVRGFVAGSHQSGRRRIERSWRRLLRQDGFWS